MNWDQFNQTKTSIEEIITLVARCKGWILAYPRDEDSSHLNAEMGQALRALELCRDFSDEAMAKREDIGDPSFYGLTKD